MQIHLLWRTPWAVRDKPQVTYNPTGESQIFLLTHHFRCRNCIQGLCFHVLHIWKCTCWLNIFQGVYFKIGPTDFRTNRSIFIHLCWFFDNRAPTIVVIMSTQFAIRQVFKSDGVNNRQQIHTTKYEILFLLKKNKQLFQRNCKIF